MTGVQPRVPGGAQGALHAWDYWRIIWQGRRVLAVVLGASLSLALAGTFLVAKRYRAEALVEINLAPALVLGTDTERSTARLSFFEQEHAFKTEFVKLRTRSLLSAAIETHDLRRTVPALAGMKDPVGLLQRQVSADRMPQTNVATISVSWWDPGEAATIANAVAATYVAADLAHRVQALDERAGRLDESAREKGRLKRAQVERELAIMRSDADVAALLSLPSLKDDEALGALAEALSVAERELHAMSANYGPNSPERQQKHADVAEARRQVRAAVAAVATTLATELKALEGDPDSLPPPGPLAEAVALSQQAANAKFETDLREKAVAQKLLMSLAEPRARVIEEARPPAKHYAPRMALNLALAFVVGLAFGGGVLFFREYLDASIRTLDDIEKDLGLATLAVIPAWSGEPPKEVSEAFQTLRTGLLFSSAGRRDRIVLVTSAGPREGKTSVVVGLAQALVAAGESVAVVDADLRRPCAANALGIAGSPKGLSNHLADPEASDWRGLVVRAGPRLDVLPAGPVPPNPVSLLGLPRFAESLAALKASHDWVLLDSPPVGSVSDSLVLASLAELTVLVLRHDVTDREVVRRTLGRLAGVSARVAGAVLAGVDMSAAYNRDFYYGRFFYGQQYGGEEADGGAMAPGWRGRVERASRKLLRGR